MVGYYKALGEDPWKALPVTFHVSNGAADPEWEKFLTFHEQVERQKRAKTIQRDQELWRWQEDDSEYESSEHGSDSDMGVDFKYKIPTNTWIVKPGENTNWGNGIVVCSNMREVK